MIAIGLVAKVARTIVGSEPEPKAAASSGAAVDVLLLLIQVPLVLPPLLPETLVGLDGDDDDAYADDLIASNRLS